MPNFRVGQKVVCIDDRPNPRSGYQPPITKDQVYTVSATGYLWDGFGIDLVESPAPQTSPTPIPPHALQRRTIQSSR
jgi:hypothetical protein